MSRYIYLYKKIGNKQKWRGRHGNSFPGFMPVRAVRVKGLLILRKNQKFQKCFRQMKDFCKQTHEVIYLKQQRFVFVGIPTSLF